jgi:tetratricopeptide (TPR) repeat protein
MSEITDPQALNEQGKQAFQAGQLEQAVDSFRAAALAYVSSHDELNAAESRNNLSVALLQLGKSQESLEAALGTDELFAKAGDLKRQGMALGNQAAALESLKRFDEALAAYEHSAVVFEQAGEGDLRAMVLKSAAGVKLRSGKVKESVFKMVGSLEAKQNPSIFERILRTLVRFVQR